MGPVEDERRSAPRIGNAMNKETKLRARPAAITLTPAAEARIAELMGRAPEGAIGVKLSTPRRGCSGLAYSVDYVTEEQPFDEKIETPGGAFYVDGASRALPDRLDHGLARGRFRRRLRVRQSQRQGRLRLRRKLHRLSARVVSAGHQRRWPMRVFMALAALSISVSATAAAGPQFQSGQGPPRRIARTPPATSPIRAASIEASR